MKKLFFGLLLGFILVSGVAEAASISFYRREALIGPEETSIEDTIVFEEAPGSLEIPLFFRAYDFNTRSTLSNHSCEMDDVSYGSVIRCDIPEGEGGRLSLIFNTEGLVRHTGDHYYFEDSLDAPYSTGNMVYNAKLKEGFVLIDEDLDTPFQRFLPDYGQENTDGRRIYVIWSQEDVQKGNGIRPRVSFERTEEVVRDLNEAYIVLLGAVLVLLMIAVGARLGTEDVETIPDALKEDERKIMKIIEDSGGEIKQKRIVNAVDFSKAKVSRLVHDLKDRGLLETEKVGRTNRVKLKKRE